MKSSLSRRKDGSYVLKHKTIKGKKGIFVVENIEGTNALSRVMTIAMIVQQ